MGLGLFWGAFQGLGLEVQDRDVRRWHVGLGLGLRVGTYPFSRLVPLGS